MKLEPATEFELVSYRDQLCKPVVLTQPYWIVVDELSMDAPRKSPELPNVQVRVVRCDEPGRSLLEHFETLFIGTENWPIHRHLGPFKKRVDAVKQKRKVSSILSGLGFTINGDTSVRGVYVIELDQSHAPVPSQPWVYVGETSKAFEVRFEEHKAGKRNRSDRGRLFVKVVREHGVCLREDLYPPPPNRYYSQSASQAAERFWIQHLEAKGFQVEGGHEENRKTSRRFS
jgi:hypothetical protein